MERGAEETGKGGAQGRRAGRGRAGNKGSSSQRGKRRRLRSPPPGDRDEKVTGPCERCAEVSQTVQRLEKELAAARVQLYQRALVDQALYVAAAQIDYIMARRRNQLNPAPAPALQQETGGSTTGAAL